MEDYSSLDKRISILEVKFNAMEKTIEKINDKLEQSYDVSIQIKERLDKWNGTIPHMAEDMKSLKENQTNLSKALIKNEINDEQHSTKMKVVWGVFTTIGGRTSRLFDKSSFSLILLLFIAFEAFNR